MSKFVLEENLFSLGNSYNFYQLCQNLGTFTLMCITYANQTYFQFRCFLACHQKYSQQLTISVTLPASTVTPFEQNFKLKIGFNSLTYYCQFAHHQRFSRASSPAHVSHISSKQIPVTTLRNSWRKISTVSRNSTQTRRKLTEAQICYRRKVTAK